MGFYGCKKCQGDSTIAAEIALVGDYHTRLCDSCVNDWNSRMLTHPHFIELGATQTRLAVTLEAVRGGHKDPDLAVLELDRLQARALVLKGELHAAAKAWEGTLAPPPAAIAPPSS